MADLAVATATPETQKPKEFTKSRPMSLSELLSTNYPPQEWLVQGLIPADGITMIYGLPGVYKTRLVASMVKSAATGEPWLGAFPTTLSGILLIDEENGPALMQVQFKQLGATADLPIQVRSRQNFVVNEKNMQRVLQDCQEYALNAVVFDPFVYIHTANENDAHEMSAIMKLFQILTDEGIAVIFLHHSKKPDANNSGGRHSFRGTSVLMGAVDSAIEIKLDEERVLNIEQHKSRRSPDLLSFKVEVSDDDDYLEFGYAGATGSEAKRAKKSDMVCHEAKEILGRGELLQYELVARLNAALPEVKVSDKNIKKLLKPLLDSGVIKIGSGNRNSKPYYLAEQQGTNETEPDSFATDAQKAVESGDFAEVSIHDLLADTPNPQTS